MWEAGNTESRPTTCARTTGAAFDEGGGGGGGEHLDGDAARPSCASVPAVSPSNERVLQTHRLQ
jgi:hypothetical protein